MKDRIQDVDNFRTGGYVVDPDPNWWLKDRVKSVHNLYNRIAGELDKEYWKYDTCLRYIRNQAKKQGLKLERDNLVLVCEGLIKKFRAMLDSIQKTKPLWKQGGDK